VHGTGLVEGEGFAVDASVIEANASRFQRVEGSEVEWTDEQWASRPVREYLATLDGEHSPITIVPFSPLLDPRTTPIILASGKAFVGQRHGQGKRVGELRPAERTAIRQAYDAGQVILLLDASTHDISPAAGQPLLLL
jgi:hypothetical protein